MPGVQSEPTLFSSMQKGEFPMCLCECGWTFSEYGDMRAAKTFIKCVINWILIGKKDMLRKGACLLEESKLLSLSACLCCGIVVVLFCPLFRRTSFKKDNSWHKCVSLLKCTQNTQQRTQLVKKYCFTYTQRNVFATVMTP